MQRFFWKDMNDADRKAALSRPAALDDAERVSTVKTILSDVCKCGDNALRDYTLRFDGVALEALRVPTEKLETAWRNLPAADRHAINTARENIKSFHLAQKPEDILVETMPGVTCRREARALDTVGLYVPGGTAPLVSTVLMLAIPAKVAGVKRRIMVSPPDKDGNINQAILAAAYRCHITDVFCVGGAQAIAAMAYGTETVPRCEKIFGPGNAYVALAKSLVAQQSGGPAIDLPAGPSEAMVVADDQANPAFVASDMLSQAEHDVLAQVVCIASTDGVASNIEAEIQQQLATLPRQEIAAASLVNAIMIVENDRTQVVDIINRYAPEHLILQIEQPDGYVPAVRNAGSIFIGPWTPESAGDYASGTNHTLPTNGAARAYSGVTTESFIKFISVQKLSADGLQALGPTIERLAEMEGLDAHKRAVSLRLESLSS